MQLGATTPLHDENSAWRPLFTEKCALRRYPMTPLFKFCDQNVGQMYKSRRYSVQKLMNFFNQESKNFRALFLYHPFGALFSGCPSFNFELDPRLARSGLYSMKVRWSSRRNRHKGGLLVIAYNKCYYLSFSPR